MSTWALVIAVAGIAALGGRLIFRGSGRRCARIRCTRPRLPESDYCSVEHELDAAYDEAGLQSPSSPFDKNGHRSGFARRRVRRNK